MRRERSRTSDFIWYFVISLGVIGLVIAVSEGGYDWNNFLKWGCFAAFTAVIFGQFIMSSRALWKVNSYWVFTGGVFLAHCAVYIVTLSRMSDVKPPWFLRMLLELALMLLCRGLLFRRELIKQT